MKPLHLGFLIKFALQEQDGTQVLIARRKLMILLRDNFQCTECGERDLLTIDHSNGGQRDAQGNRTLDSYGLEECKVLCTRCHYRKNGVTLQRDKSTVTFYDEYEGGKM